MHSPTYIALLAVSLRLFSLAAAKSQRVVILTDTNFDNLTRHGAWLVDVWAPWYATTLTANAFCALHWMCHSGIAVSTAMWSKRTERLDYIAHSCVQFGLCCDAAIAVH